MRVPYNSNGLVYYEFDIALDSSYRTNSRGVGRVVMFLNGFSATGYDSSPVAVYTDDHYATFQEFNNLGQFLPRFNAESRITNLSWSVPTYLTRQVSL